MTKHGKPNQGQKPRDAGYAPREQGDRPEGQGPKARVRKAQLREAQDANTPVNRKAGVEDHLQPEFKRGARAKEDARRVTPARKARSQ